MTMISVLLSVYMTAMRIEDLQVSDRIKMTKLAAMIGFPADSKHLGSVSSFYIAYRINIRTQVLLDQDAEKLRWERVNALIDMTTSYATYI